MLAPGLAADLLTATFTQHLLPNRIKALAESYDAEIFLAGAPGAGLELEDALFDLCQICPQAS